jgi:hypothetical protein
MRLTAFTTDGKTIYAGEGQEMVHAACWLHAKKLLGFPLTPLQEELLERQLTAAAESPTTPTKENT